MGLSIAFGAFAALFVKAIVEFNLEVWDDDQPMPALDGKK
jgi:hypothetical protein